MKSCELEKIREIWLTEKSQYNSYSESILNELKELFNSNKVKATYSSRIKEDDSLLKKALIKNKSYKEIFDKVGARVIVYFLSDIEKCDRLIVEYFGDRIKERDDKMLSADENTFGYLSIHYNIANSLQSDALICELQLRTVCQNAWADLAHVLTYKPGIELPKNIRREVNALSALLEIADNQFQTILSMIDDLPVDSPIRILNSVSGFFYTNICAWYDSKMSYYFLDKINVIYDYDEDIIEKIDCFIEKNGDDIKKVAEERNDLLLFSQPEIIVILERLEKCPHMLQDYWREKYPIQDLSDIALAWGISLD